VDSVPVYSHLVEKGEHFHKSAADGNTRDVLKKGIASHAMKGKNKL